MTSKKKKAREWWVVMDVVEDCGSGAFYHRKTDAIEHYELEDKGAAYPIEFLKVREVLRKRKRGSP